MLEWDRIDVLRALDIRLMIRLDDGTKWFLLVRDSLGRFPAVRRQGFVRSLRGAVDSYFMLNSVSVFKLLAKFLNLN